LARQHTAVLTDRLPAPATRPKELILRLQMGRCELCERPGGTQLHHVAKLADLTRPGRPHPTWAQIMAHRRRKTLIVCPPCHDIIHQRQPTATTTQ
jgi:hypothetical protein